MTGLKVLIEKNEVTVSVTAHLHNLKTADPATEIADRLKLRLNGKIFSARKPQLIRDPANGIVIWQGKQPRSQLLDDSSQGDTMQVAVDAPIFPDTAGQSTVVTVFQDRQAWGEAVLDESDPTALIGKNHENTTTFTVVLRFLGLGIEHIFGGIDHVLFLLSLLLLGGSWKRLLKIVTAFTLAHSITLSLAATGLFSLPPRIVEPVIALSIVIVAVANFFTVANFTRVDNVIVHRGKVKDGYFDHRSYLAFGFGLIHGFGFAGALSEIGLPREALGWALLAFNGGVEVGQAALVLLFAPALALLAKRWPRMQVPLVHTGSAAVAIVGAFWFVERVFAA